MFPATGLASLLLREVQGLASGKKVEAINNGQKIPKKDQTMQKIIIQKANYPHLLTYNPQSYMSVTNLYVVEQVDGSIRTLQQRHA